MGRNPLVNKAFSHKVLMIATENWDGLKLVYYEFTLLLIIEFLT